MGGQRPQVHQWELLCLPGAGVPALASTTPAVAHTSSSPLKALSPTHTLGQQAPTVVISIPLALPGGQAPSW